MMSVAVAPAAGTTSTEIDGSPPPSLSEAIVTAPSDLIFPPADLRGVIEKTAQFVAKNGSEFEERVLREQSAAKFAFLLPGNPFNAYYRLKVKEFATGEAAPTPQVPQAIRDMRAREQQQQQKQQQLLMLTQIGSAETEADTKEKQFPPPPPKQFSLQHPWLAPVDVDIIQCAAQFVARNGQKFLAGLAQREQQNPQFAFLRPSHHLFAYFTSLVDAYTRCLLPPQEQLDSVKALAADRAHLIRSITSRMQYERQQLQQRREKESKTAEERRLMLSLDWSDFHIVETIDFTEEDERLPLASPIDFKTVMREAPKLLLPEDAELAENDIPTEIGDSIAALIEGAAAGEAMETDDEEQTEVQLPEETETLAAAIDTQKDGESEKEKTKPTPSALRIIKGYVRSRKRPATTGQGGLQQCPITNELIPAEQMTNHLRILLLDPKWKEQKDRFLEKARAESAFAPLEDIESNLALFVAKRPDLFGSVDDQARLEAETAVEEGHTGQQMPYVGTPAMGVNLGVPIPDGKRQRVEAMPSAESRRGILLATVVCREGDGLEAQEAQVEIDETLTASQLKQSLLDAGIGSEALRARDLQLSDAITGQPLLDHLTLREAGIRSSEARLVLSLLQR